MKNQSLGDLARLIQAARIRLIASELLHVRAGVTIFNTIIGPSAQDSLPWASFYQMSEFSAEQVAGFAHFFEYDRLSARYLVRVH
jgi:hypothetical protein